MSKLHILLLPLTALIVLASPIPKSPWDIKSADIGSAGIEVDKAPSLDNPIFGAALPVIDVTPTVYDPEAPAYSEPVFDFPFAPVADVDSDSGSDFVDAMASAVSAVTVGNPVEEVEGEVVGKE